MLPVFALPVVRSFAFAVALLLLSAFALTLVIPALVIVLFALFTTLTTFVTGSTMGKIP